MEIFTLYEDKNDTYNYEKGQYAIIEFKWNDKNRKLIIDDRKGKFPNMLQRRILHVIIVSHSKGIGVNLTQNPDKIIHYKGVKTIVVFD